MRTVLLLGSSGFLGRHGAAAFRAAGVEVVEGPSREDCDLTQWSVAELGRLTAGRDVVVNATGAVAGDEAELTRTNVDLVERLAAACTPDTRLVQLGSLAEYGPGRPRSGSGGSRPWRGTDPCRPVSPYGRSKLAGSERVLAATAAGAVDGLVLRVANPVGSGQPVGSVLGRVAANVRADRDGEVRLGALDAVRDFVSARDVARAVVAASGAGLPSRERVFTVGTGRGTTVREAVRQLLVLTDFRGVLREVDDLGSSRSAAADCSVADPTRARAHLGWQPQDSLGQALAALVADLATVPA